MLERRARDSTKEVRRATGRIVMRAELEINRLVGVRQSAANVADLELEGGRGGSPVTCSFVTKRGRADRDEGGEKEQGTVSQG
ncbi:hypothetical protein ACJRO7_029882 [Eucalyptus globulus]|uniref:Uncharacterized protein n=1 Tax=Eucalyptus globulus TaxID=34317 RepID=A0ABD3J9W9_EUCGL